MSKIAITLSHDSNIFEIDLATNTPTAMFEALYPVTVACLGEGTFAYVCGNGFKDIYREDPPYEPFFYGPDSSIYTHENWIRDIKIRYKPIRYRFFFSAYHTETSVRIFYLDEMDEPVPYCTIDGNQLLFPDSCDPGNETHWSTWGGDFTFDDVGNMYIATGHYTPSGIYKISGAGPEEVTGEIERIFLNNDNSTHSIEFIGNNKLLYVQGEQKIYSLNLQTMESTLIYDVAQFTPEAITSIARITDDMKKLNIFKKKPNIFRRKDIRFK